VTAPVRRTRRSGPRPFATTAGATPLLTAAGLRRDWADCQRLPVSPRASGAADAWADALFADPPPWVSAALRTRDRAVRAVGLRPAGTSTFPVVARTADEVLVGSDDRHLDFRASVRHTGRAVDVTTVVQTHGLLGRTYLAPVRVVHGALVRAMLQRAARRLDPRG
jgi:uncharacterized protein DUF2867